MARATKAERRTQIVEALARCLHTRSYAESSIGVIAKEAGITAGLVHYHFHTKRDILVELASRMSNAWTERMASRLASAHTPEEHIRAVIDAALSTESADPEHVTLWVLLAAEASRDPDIAAFVRQVSDRTLNELRCGLRKTSVHDPDTSALGLLASIEGIFRLAVVGSVPPGQGAATVQRLLDALLGCR